MTDKKIIIIGVISVLLLATIGYVIVNPIDFDSLNIVKKDIYEEKDDNKNEVKDDLKFETTKYQISFNTIESENENENKIEFDINYSKDKEDVTYSDTLIFNKEDGTLLNEDVLEKIDNEDLKEIANQIVSKIQSGNLYKINSLNMSYYSSSKTNVK